MTSKGGSPQAADGQADGWYRGDCHVHSACSNGGELTPGQLARDARAAGLDFVAATEHNSVATHEEWRALARDDFLVVPGEEVTTADGHWLALGLSPGQLIDGNRGAGQLIDGNRGAGDGRLEACLDEVHEAGGLCVAAHPHAPYPTGEFRHSLQGFDAVEVWNGLWTSDLPWNADNEKALTGWHRSLTESIRAGGGAWRPAVGNSDTHLEDQIAVPHTVVRAPALTTAAVLAGIRAGRSWIAGSSTVDLSFTAYAGERDAGPGDRLATLGAPTTVRVRIGGVPSGTVSFHTDRGRVHDAPLPPDAHGSGSAEWRTTAADSTFVRVEVRHPDGHMAALTNPVVLA